MSSRIAVPADLALAPFHRSLALEKLGRRTLEGPSYRRLTRGAYWTAVEPLDHGRLIEGLRAVLPDDAVLRGVSAAWAHGVSWAGIADPVEVALAHQRRVRPRAGLLVSGEQLEPDEIVPTGYGASTSVARTAFDLARRLPLPRAVAAMDALLRVGPGLTAEVERVVEAHPRARGRRQVIRALALADPRAESPRESMLRVALIGAGLPAPVPQFEVWEGGRFVARLDLAWPEHRVAIEYDGAHHREQHQHSLDLGRHNQLRALGWTVFQVDARLLARIDGLIAVLNAALHP
jgi:Protein of unknown function (DUF559)